MNISLVVFGGTAGISWPAGEVILCEDQPASIHDALARVDRGSDGVLCWNAQLGAPDPALCESLLAGRADIWHAGLKLGNGSRPGLIDFVAPNWMLNCDPPVDIESTSWRLSFSACLMRTSVLSQLGLPRPEMDSVDGAALEWGHRCVMRGALPRHVPALVKRGLSSVDPISLRDEVRFLVYRYGAFWTRWALARAALTGYAPRWEIARVSHVLPTKPYAEPAPYNNARSMRDADVANARVTVLIPTLNRYKYLHTVLAQLRAQTVQPLEIIIIDQSAHDRRDDTITDKFSDLPLRLLYQDEPGQCTSRNAGLKIARGDFILFIDDDDEIPVDLIERHLANLARFDADVSSGVAQEIGDAPLPPNETFTVASHVFPTNNTLARRSVLYRSGLFDTAFNRAPRADGDLGMRIYLTGALMVLDQSIAVLHHRAGEGGLRAHKARVITYKMSREMLTKRHLPHISEIYLTSRYFSKRQTREMLWMRTFGTLSGRGTSVQRAAKLLIGAAQLPDTIRETLARERDAREWLTRFPQIDSLHESKSS